MRKTISSTILILFVFPNFTFSNGIDSFTINSKKTEITNSIEVLIDTSSKLDFQQVLASTQFIKYGQKVPNLGVSPYTYWIKFQIINNINDSSFLLEIENSIIDTLDFYYLLPNNKWKVVKTGEFLRISDREYEDQNFVFNLNIPKDKIHTYYLRVRSGDIIVVPISLSPPNTFHKLHLEKELIFGIYAGIIIVMFLYNLFLFITVRDRNYLYYVSYIIFVGLTQIILQGYSYKYLWPNSPYFANLSLILFAALAGISIVLFQKHFLEVKKHSPILSIGLDLIIIGYFIAVPLRFFGQNNIYINNVSYNLADILAGVIGFYSLIIAIVLSFKGNRSAKFFLLAWSMFLIGMFCFVLRNFGVLPYNNFTNYAMPFGNAVEVILLSFALADRINILKKEKEISQTQALEISKENERLVTNQKMVLEREVAERTFDLESAYKDLQETQSQLVNSEKMASLGQLTAGVAHEINNPINFVVSNINPLRRDINDLKELLNKYNEIENAETYSEKMIEIEKFKKEIDYNYVQEEIEILLKGITEGANRTAEIVKSLRSFSRLDENDIKRTNINEGISSSLVLLTQQINSIKVIENLGNIPEIDCYPGKINQVFMNLLNNAIEAINSNHKENGLLEISTSKEGDNVLITIKDNGIGMPDDVKSKIFEPFYTTKDVGKGTGLGLSISHGIIEKHNGSITVKSQVGVGTIFEIRLPIVSK